MPTADDKLILDGSLGLETNLSPRSGNPKTFRVFKDCVTDVAGRIVKRDGKGPTLGSVAGTEIQAIEEYIFRHPKTGNDYYHTLGAIDGGFSLYRWDGASTWAAQTLPITPTVGGRWGFLALGGDDGNCIFAFNGIDPLLIGACPRAIISITSAGTLATATCASGHGFNNGETVVIGGATPGAYNGSYVITVVSSTVFTYVFAGGVSPATGEIVAAVVTRIAWRLAGIDAPSFAPTYSLVTNDPPVTTGTVSGVKGSPTIRSTVGPNWSGGTMNGKRIGLNGNTYTISTIDVGGGGGIDQVLTLTEGLKEDTPDVWKPLTPYTKGTVIQPTATIVGGFNVTGNGLFYECTTAGASAAGEPAWPTVIGNTVNDGTAVWTCRAGWSYAILLGAGSWDDIAPQYRFAYENEATGHISNPSPILQVTEVNQQSKTITLTIPASPENQAAYVNGYKKIRIFRTPSSAGIPVAINEKLDNVNSAVTPIVYIETATKFRDTYLTDFQAPLLNYKPLAGFSAMAFQQGRAWAIHKPSGRVVFTPIGVEVDFGRSIECWPPAYRLAIDSLPRGLVVVGARSATDSLVIQTSRRDFSVEGYNSVTFTPYGLSTRKSGSYLGAATDVDGRFISFYADNRLMMDARALTSYALASRNDIGQKIQDRLSFVKPSLISKVRLHWFAANSRNYVLLSIPSSGASTANDYTYVFDLDLDGGPIYEWPFGVSAFATVHDPATLALQLFAGDPSGAVYRLFSGVHQDAGANFAPTVRTAHFRSDEMRSEVKYIKLFVNDAQLDSGGPKTKWTGTLWINEQANALATDGTATPLVFRVLDYRSQSAQGRELIAGPFTVSTRTKSKVMQIDVTFPTANADLWIEQIVIGSDNDQIATMVGQPGNQA